VLESTGSALGAVSAIAGQTRLWVVVNGTQVRRTTAVGKIVVVMVTVVRVGEGGGQGLMNGAHCFGCVFVCVCAGHGP